MFGITKEYKNLLEIKDNTIESIKETYEDIIDYYEDVRVQHEKIIELQLKLINKLEQENSIFVDDIEDIKNDIKSILMYNKIQKDNGNPFNHPYSPIYTAPIITCTGSET